MRPVSYFIGCKDRICDSIFPDATHVTVTAESCVKHAMVTGSWDTSYNWLSRSKWMMHNIYFLNCKNYHSVLFFDILHAEYGWCLVIFFPFSTNHKGDFMLESKDLPNGLAKELRGVTVLDDTMEYVCIYPI